MDTEVVNTVGGGGITVPPGEVVSGMADLDLSPVITALTSAVTPTQIITLIASLIAFGIPFVFMWFGIRKVIKIFRSAVMGGRITV